MTKNSDRGSRGLSPEFRDDLKGGLLHPILQIVKADCTLDLEIRDNYINIYYRGGNLLKITETDGGYSAQFEGKYFEYSSDGPFYKLLDKTQKQMEDDGMLSQTMRRKKDIEAWIDIVPNLKQAIDLHLGKSKKDEREYQQVLVRENNYGRLANSTDYYICDIEYATKFKAKNGPKKVRFDLVGVYWSADGHKRRPTNKGRLVFFEMKYGDGAINDPNKETPDAGSDLQAHVCHISEFLEDDTRLEELKDEMILLFEQKKELDVIKCAHTLPGFTDEKPELVVILANSKPRGTALRDALGKLPTCDKAELKIAVSTFAGYGLFEQNVLPLDKFKKKFDKQICSRKKSCK